MVWRVGTAGFALLIAACIGPPDLDTDARPQSDASWTDAPPEDATTVSVDGGGRDAGPRDADVDGAATDAPATDAPAPDSDAAALDAATGDAGVPDASPGSDGGGPGAVLEWVVTIANGEGVEIPRSVAAFPDGSSVVAGYFADDAIFGPGDPTETTLTAAGSYDIFLARYTAAGTLAWVTRAGGTEDDRGFRVTIAADGSILLCGMFSGSATFGEGEPNETSLVSAGLDDAFAARYNADGTLRWVVAGGGTMGDAAHDVRETSSGGILVAGNYYQDAVFSGTLLTAPNGGTFVILYDADGTLTWATSAQSMAGGVGTASVAVRSDGSFLVAGGFDGTTTFGAGEPAETTLVGVAGAGNNLFLAQYAADGTFAWVVTADPGPGGSVNAHRVYELPTGGIIVSGLLSGGDATFGAGEPAETVMSSAGNLDPFIARYNADGTLAWAKRGGGADRDDGESSLGPGDVVTIAGTYENSATFGLGEPGETTLTGGPWENLYLAQCGLGGALLWASHVSSGPWARDVATAGSSVWVTGTYPGISEFQVGSGAPITLTSSPITASDDAYLMRVTF